MQVGINNQAMNLSERPSFLDCPATGCVTYQTLSVRWPYTHATIIQSPNLVTILEIKF